MGDGFQSLRVTFSNENYARLLRWKEQYEAKHGGSVTWADLLLAYANSTP